MFEDEVSLVNDEQLPDEADAQVEQMSSTDGADADTIASTMVAPAATQPRGYEVSSSMTHISYANEKEAAVISRILAKLVDEGDLRIADIGVTSPYNGQVGLLVDLFRERDWIRQHVPRRTSHTQVS